MPSRRSSRAETGVIRAMGPRTNRPTASPTSGRRRLRRQGKAANDAGRSLARGLRPGRNRRGEPPVAVERGELRPGERQISRPVSQMPVEARHHRVAAVAEPVQRQHEIAHLGPERLHRGDRRQLALDRAAGAAPGRGRQAAGGRALQRLQQRAEGGEVQPVAAVVARQHADDGRPVRPGEAGGRQQRVRPGRRVRQRRPRQDSRRGRIRQSVGIERAHRGPGPFQRARKEGKPAPDEVDHRHARHALYVGIEGGGGSAGLALGQGRHGVGHGAPRLCPLARPPQGRGQSTMVRPPETLSTWPVT